MSQASSVAFAAVHEHNLVGAAASPPGKAEHVSLRGTTRGLEILVAGSPSTAALGAQLTALLAEAPGFFAGSDARVAFDGPLPAGALACLEQVAAQFELRLVEIGPVARRNRTYAAVVRRADRATPVKLAEGTGPIADGAGMQRGHEAGSATAELPVLPGGPATGDAHRAPSGPGSAEAELASPAATPIEVALANTRPYRAVILTAEALHDAPDALVRNVTMAEAAAIEVALAGAVPIDRADEDCRSAGHAAGHLAPGDRAARGETPASCAAAIEVAVAHAVEAVSTMAVAAESVAPEAVTAAVTEAATAAAPEVVTAAPEAVTEAAIAAAAAAMAEVMAVKLAAKLAEALAEERAAELVAAMPQGPRLVIGPVRSGVIVDHTGHVIVIGDVNPGAEVRAEGSIIVLGRLRGVAHAAIGRDAGCIVALSLQPQQLRIGRMVARAADADRPGGGAEIAYATGETIVVERFLGRLPSGLAASM
jgi:septum site-determining protein MinC